jgi:Ni,Fe-hydrogenase III component G
MSGVRVLHRVSTDTVPHRAEDLLASGFRLALVAAHDDGDRLRVVYLFLAGRPDRRIELECIVPASDPAVRSLAYMSFPAGRFEREMLDLYGVKPIGHPRPRRLVRHAHWPEGWYPMRAEAGAAPELFASTGRFPFVTVEGTGVYEIPVGPVHAGLIEPGHFRFSVVGETILRLKARLWFVHRGQEKLFHGRPATEATELAERVSGDTSAGHALAHSLAVEDALGVSVPDEVHRLRALVVELERLHNNAAGSASSRDGAAPSCIGWRSTAMPVSPARRSSTHPGSTGRHCPSRWPTRSSPTSHWPTRVSICPTLATISDDEFATRRRSVPS